MRLLVSPFGSEDDGDNNSSPPPPPSNEGINHKSEAVVTNVIPKSPTSRIECESSYSETPYSRTPPSTSNGGEILTGKKNVSIAEKLISEDSSDEMIAPPSSASPAASYAPQKRIRSSTLETGHTAKKLKSNANNGTKSETKIEVTEGHSIGEKSAKLKMEGTAAANFDPLEEYPRVINPSKEALNGRRPVYQWGEGVVPAYKVYREKWRRIEEEEDNERNKRKMKIELDYKEWLAVNRPNVKRKTKKPPAEPTDANIEPVHRWWIRAASLAPGEELPTAPWPYFEHKGLIFTPHYERHNQPLLVRGKEVVLEDEAEEICNFWCGAITSDYASKEVFQNNFWAAFCEALPKDHMILDKSQWDNDPITFKDLDFTVIHDFLVERKLRQTEANKALLPEIKLMEKEKKEKQNLYFGRAIIGGLREKLQQFRTEPPSLFRPRGAHPKMGKLKRRTFPEQVSINVSEGAVVPHIDPTYLHGHSWGDVLHKDDVTWLAFYRDNVMQQYKYMYLASSSGTKGQSDFKKYEKARKLQYKIGEIRRRYDIFMRDGNTRDKQIGLAVYLIDRLALRAGNDKEEDEADTVGCCSLRKEHLTLLEERNSQNKREVYFDFLGKDSIPYQATVPIDDLPFNVMRKLLEKKKCQDQLFDEIDPTILNKQLQEWAGMSVSAKVFRTYNASITLQEELAKLDENETDPVDITALKAFYDYCNRQVAVLCNHQRAAPKTFDVTVGKMKAKLKQIKDDIDELTAWLEWNDSLKKRAFKWEPSEPDDPSVAPRKSAVPMKPTAQIVQRRLEQKQKLKEDKDVEIEVKEANRTVATGTSRMHYMDPRITVSFCKKRSVPIQKVFQKTLVNKFPWAMNVSEDFIW